MIDFKGYTQKAIQTQLLGRVSDKIDRRQGSIIQTALGLENCTIIGEMDCPIPMRRQSRA